MDLVQDLPQREQPGQSKVGQATHLIYTLSQIAEQRQRRRLGREPTADPALATVGRHLDDLEEALTRADRTNAAGTAQRETALAGGHLEDAANAAARPAAATSPSPNRPLTPGSQAQQVDLGEARAALARARGALASAASSAHDPGAAKRSTGQEVSRAFTAAAATTRPTVKPLVVKR